MMKKILIELGEPLVEEWSLSFSSIIPDIGKGYFLYVVNNEVEEVVINKIKISSSIGGVHDTYIAVDRIQGDLTSNRSTSITPASMSDSDTELDLDVVAADVIHNVELIAQLDRLDISSAFSTEILDTHITVKSGNTIGLRWGASVGALAGTIIISKVMVENDSKTTEAPDE